MGLTRVLLFVVIVGVAIDYFVFDMQYERGAGVYLQKISRDIRGEVTRYLERGR